MSAMLAAQSGSQELMMENGSPDITPYGDGGDFHAHLQRFVVAKAQIITVYKNLSSYLVETGSFLEDSFTISSKVSQNYEQILREAKQQAEKHSEKVIGISGVLKRDRMNVVFFGRTSNGKSTVINALLGENILPTGIGHTTSCFLQVEGGSSNEAYVMTEDSNEPKSIQSIANLGNALCNEKLEPNAKVQIIWPKSKCKMLGAEVVLIDSPGIDVETDLDEWIDKFCLDSDVFVLVANSESTLMLTEKKFFHKVSERLSRPNIFIVHNRSDAFAGEENQYEVRAQHTDRAKKFLVDELKVCSKNQEAESRIFFVSAKEALKVRTCEANGIPPQISTEGFQTRFDEFRRFEDSFSDCLSKTAVNTKFAQHSRRGEQIMREIGETLELVYNSSVQEVTVLKSKKKELCERRDFVSEQLEHITFDMKEKIRSLTEDVEYRVGMAMNEEIRRVSVLVDDFNDPFHPEPMVVNVFKRRLNQHIEVGIGSNLRSRLSTELQLNVESFEQEMIGRITALLPPEKQQLSRNIVPKRDNFDVLYHLHIENLFTDFQEDIRFRFSLGLGSIYNRFMNRNRNRPNSSKGIPRQLSNTTSPTREYFTPPDDWSIVSKIAIAAVSSRGTVGGLLAGGLLIKTVGWRFILVAGGFYAAVYMYERLTWTNNAKCKEFKRQYVEHLARKLRLIVDMTSSNCSHQVQQELSSTFARLCLLVDETTTDFRENILEIEQTLGKLDQVVASSNKLRIKGRNIEDKLQLFEKNFLTSSQD